MPKVSVNQASHKTTKPFINQAGHKNEKFSVLTRLATTWKTYNSKYAISRFQQLVKAPPEICYPNVPLRCYT